MATKTTRKRKVSFVDEFVDAVKEKLDARGMSISQLATDANLSRVYVSRVLSKQQTPSLKVAEDIASCVGLTLTTKNI